MQWLTKTMTELWANTWPRCFGSQTRLTFSFDDLIALELFLVYLAVKVRTLQTIVECGHVTQTCAIRQRAPANSGAKLFSRFCFCDWIAEQCGNRVHTLKISLDWQNLRSIICQQIRGIVGGRVCLCWFTPSSSLSTVWSLDCPLLFVKKGW